MRSAWEGPPRDILGHAAPVQQFVARTDRVVVALQQVVAFPEGCVLTLHIAARRGPLADSAWQRLLRVHTGEADPDAVPAHGGLKFGIRLPDGSRATTVDNAFPGWARPTDRPEPPMLVAVGGGSSSSGDSYQGEQRLWLWPLPPPAPFEFVVEWPDLGLGVTATMLDGGAIAAVADLAQPYWP